MSRYDVANYAVSWAACPVRSGRIFLASELVTNGFTVNAKRCTALRLTGRNADSGGTRMPTRSPYEGGNYSKDADGTEAEMAVKFKLTFPDGDGLAVGSVPRHRRLALYAFNGTVHVPLAYCETPDKADILIGQLLRAVTEHGELEIDQAAWNFIHNHIAREISLGNGSD
jgi:hypothetical protein